MTISNLNTNYVDGTYIADLYELLKRRENVNLNFTGIHGDEGGVAGDPAIGYGFDLSTWTISQIASALTYAFGGTLTADQQNGVDIIGDFKNGTISGATLIAIANGSAGTGAQQTALQSLQMTDVEATLLLDVVVLGRAGFTGFENALNTLLQDEGGLAESRERVAVMSMYYNLPALVGGGLQHAIDTDNRAEAWYEIRYHHQNWNDADVQDRRVEESDIFGLTSINATDEEVKLALSFLFNGTDSQSNNVYQEILSRDVHDPFVDAIQDELDALTTVLGLQEEFHFVQADAPGLSSQLAPGSAEGHGPTTNNLMFGQDGDDTISGGDGNDAIYGDFGNPELDISLGAGSDSLSGDAGDDTIDGGAGDDRINGGASNDELYGESGRDALLGGTGTDKLYGDDDSEVDFLIGGEGADEFHVGNRDIIVASDVLDAIYYGDLLLEGGQALFTRDHDGVPSFAGYYLGSKGEIYFNGDSTALYVALPNSAGLIALIGEGGLDLVFDEENPDEPLFEVDFDQIAELDAAVSTLLTDWGWDSEIGDFGPTGPAPAPAADDWYAAGIPLEPV